MHRTLIFRASLCEATGDVVAANRARDGLLDFMKTLYGPNDWRVKSTEQDFGKREQSARIATGPDQKSGEPKASEPDFSRFYRRETSEELAVILLVALDAMGRCRARSRSTAPGSSANWPSCCSRSQILTRKNPLPTGERTVKRGMRRSSPTSEALYFQGDFDAASLVYDKARQSIVRRNGSTTRAITVPWSPWHGWSPKRAITPRARSLLEQAIAIIKAEWHERHPDYDRSLTDLAVVLIRLGDYAAARPLVERALEIAETDRGRRQNRGRTGRPQMLASDQRRQNRGRDPGGLEMLGPMIGRSREPDTDPEVARDAANSAHTERPGQAARRGGGIMPRQLPCWKGRWPNSKRPGRSPIGLRYLSRHAGRYTQGPRRFRCRPAIV